MLARMLIHTSSVALFQKIKFELAIFRLGGVDEDGTRKYLDKLWLKYKQRPEHKQEVACKMRWHMEAVTWTKKLDYQFPVLV